MIAWLRRPELPEVDLTGLPDLDPRSLSAINQCIDEIRWYARHSRLDWYLFRFFQAAVVILSGSVPILLLIPGIPKYAQALPPALAAVLAAVAGSYHWHEDAVRWATTRELLRSELRQFVLRAGAYQLQPEEALNTFVYKKEGIVTRELGQWQAAEQPPPKQNDGHH